MNLSFKKKYEKATGCIYSYSYFLQYKRWIIHYPRRIAVRLCGGKSRIIESENEEIIKIEVKDFSSADKEKFVQFTLVETDRKGGKYRIVNCYPNKDPKKSVIKTIKTNYKLN